MFPISAMSRAGILAESIVPVKEAAGKAVKDAPEPENNGAFISLFETNLALA